MSVGATLSGQDIFQHEEWNTPERIRVQDSAARKHHSDTATAGSLYVTSASPWLADELKKLAKLGSLRPNWGSTDASPPNETAVQLTRQVLEQLADVDFKPDRLDPSTDEGICISFRRANRYADIECFNTGEVLAVTSLDEGTPSIWEPSDIKTTVAKIFRFILG